MSRDQTPLTALLIEDNPGDAQLIKHHLNATHVQDLVGDITVHLETSLTEGIAELDTGRYDILFLDLGLPESTGLETLDTVLSEGPRVPIVVLTGLDDRETAVSAIQRGAQDYLPKDELDAGLLARTLRYAIERHRQAETLRQKNERLDKFASVVSHDLRNPLNVALGRLELAQQDCDSDHLDDVAGALDRIQTLIDDLLTLAQEGDRIGELEPVDLSSFGNRCWSTVATTDAELITDTDLTIRADRNRLRQLLENLFRNAVEHGGTDLTISIGAHAEKSGFYVADDGSGIPTEMRSKIFESGYTTSENGTGFGLVIVREIADAHEWAVSVTDSQRGGTRFEFTGVNIVG